jgi:hypothetical protein
MKFRLLYVLAGRSVLPCNFLVGLPSLPALYYTISWTLYRRVCSHTSILFFAHVTRRPGTLLSRSPLSPVLLPSWFAFRSLSALQLYQCIVNAGTRSHVGCLALWVHHWPPLFPETRRAQIPISPITRWIASSKTKASARNHPNSPSRTSPPRPLGSRLVSGQNWASPPRVGGLFLVEILA